MARFRGEDADKYGGQGNGGGFFGLENHKDTAEVRFMYDTIDDFEGFSVHKVDVGGKDRYVNCLREYNEPVDACPLCAEKNKVLAKFFILVYEEESQEVKIWDRGKTFYSKMSGLFSRYTDSNTLMVNNIFEVERNGKKGDTKTSYEIFHVETDDMTFEDLPELPQILGGLVLDKNFDELEEYLELGTFADEEEAPPKRNPGRDRRGGGRGKRDEEEAPPRRRPARGRAKEEESEDIGEEFEDDVPEEKPRRRGARGSAKEDEAPPKENRRQTPRRRNSSNKDKF